jgi:hypothetical protein
MRPAAPLFRPASADWAHAAAIAVALFALYAASAPRTVALEDDGLFVLSSYFLGIGHPPGYPLFILVGHLFTALPIGAVAYRVHLASALFGALSCAALWLCARSVGLGRLPAHLAALALGVSPVFWSQSIIAEVYTLNTLFLLVLTYLGLRAAHDPRVLKWMALVFGLSLSNHYPLMLIAAPAFALLLWPARAELWRRLWYLPVLVAAGLLPYAWMVYHSRTPLPISFAGELDTLFEIALFVSRAGYAGVDQSITADWLDRVRYFGFLGRELLVQFAVIGTLLAAAGLAAQWRWVGARIAAFFTVVFLMSSVGLVLLLGFDYDVLRKHTFHVYPLPAYAVCALWIGLGFDWLASRAAPHDARAVSAAGVLAALMLVAGGAAIVRDDPAWAERYAKTMLKILPKDAAVFGVGEADLVPIAYFHMVENARPDLTLYHTGGLVLGNRLFHPLRTGRPAAERIVRDAIDRMREPVVFALDPYPGYAQRDRWLYIEVDKSSREAKRVTVDIPEEAIGFFEESVARPSGNNAWAGFFQSVLRFRYAMLLAQSLPDGEPRDARSRRHYELLAQDFYGALGVAEGMMRKADFASGTVAAWLDKARDLMPSDTPREYASRYLALRGTLRARMKDHPGAIQDLEAALALWPVPVNAAIEPLRNLYRDRADGAALKDLEQRLERIKGRRRL